MSIWRGPTPLILASASPTRRHLLEAVGIPVVVEPARIDERALEAGLEEGRRSPRSVAEALALAKALYVSARHPDRLVLGADQVLELDGRSVAKSPDDAAALGALSALSGRTHTLYSAACLVRDGAAVAAVVDDALVTMRDLDRPTLARYVAAAGGAATRSVGGYEIEGLGLHLVDRTDGHHATILGLPLLALLRSLRTLALVGI